MSKRRWILTSVAALTKVGGFLADWNRTHLLNPNWPSHVRFYDVLTLALGSLLGASGLYFLRRSGKDPESARTRHAAALPVLDRLGRELRLPRSTDEGQQPLGAACNRRDE